MRKLICWSTIFAILMLLFGCVGMQGGGAAQVVLGPEGQNPALWRVASFNHFAGLQSAIDAQDRERIEAAGFSEAHTSLILDPAVSADFLQPYLEASRTGLAVRQADGVCSVYVMGTKKLQEVRAEEGFARCQSGHALP